MKSFLFRLFFVALVPLCFFVVSIPSTSAAADGKCTCFCSSKNGAADVGRLGDIDACKAQCDKSGGKYVVCASVLDQYPANNLRCFTDKQCEGQSGGFGQEQPPECPTSMHYCFSVNKKPINLSVHIPNREDGKPVASVMDLGSYINLFYNYLLGISIFIAIVLIMVGGVQYVISSGTGNVKQAKDRITKAITGLVLLFGAYLLLFTVNPNLIKLELPQMPMVRRIDLAQHTCDQILAKWPDGTKSKGELKNVDGSPVTSGKCGDPAVVVKDSKGRVASDGTTCVFSGGCPGGESCVVNGAKGVCLSCTAVDGTGEADTKLAKIGLKKPTPGLCRSLTIPSNIPDVVSACFLSGDTAINITEEICAQMIFTCGEDVKGCNDYGDVAIDARGSIWADLDDLEPGSFLGMFESEINLKIVCESDPCNFNNCQYYKKVESGENDGCIIKGTKRAEYEYRNIK